MTKRSQAPTAPQPSRSDAPSGPWELSAPESYVLLHGLSVSPTEVLKIALRELIARDALRIAEIEQRSSGGGIRRTYVIDGGSRRRRVRRPLLGLIDLYDGMPARKIDPVKAPPVALSDFVATLLAHYDGAAGYLEREIRSALIDRGLYRHERKRHLGILRREQDVATVEGERAKADLERRLEMASQMPEWARGVAFAGLLGAAALLFEAVYPDLERLSGQLGDASAAAAAQPEPEPPLPPEFQLLGLPSGERATSEAADSGAEAAAGSTATASAGAVSAAGVAPAFPATPAPAAGDTPFALPPALAGLDLAAAMSLDLDAINLEGREAAFKAIDVIMEAATGDRGGTS